ncbi:MAG: phosphotransferase [Bacteroidia bacterium]
MNQIDPLNKSEPEIRPVDQESYPIVPGRGLVTESSTRERLEYLHAKNIHTEMMEESGITLGQISQNIESYVGSIEIPLGLVGPLLYVTGQKKEMVHTAAATLEGALVASMNRGAKAISLSGGFKAEVKHQKMLRCPMFLFSTNHEALLFANWLRIHEKGLRDEAEKHSNHAKLITTTPVVIDTDVHIYFEYSTGDASGQNMTTTCTWHAVLLAKEQFFQETQIEPIHFVIEGNGASDKKVSLGNISRGRGVKVIATCELEESVIERVLRTNSAHLLMCYEASLKITEKEGMIGYSINASNAIAALFAATGQDLGSLYESSNAFFTLSKTGKGLMFTLELSNLVVGTIGGGTHLPKQQEVLEMMGCCGSGKVKRFAGLIAGFALALEISTFSAIVGGQFAKAHEKLGRNKPVNWLTKAEITMPFVRSWLKEISLAGQLKEVRIIPEAVCENGIIINLANKVNRKLIGFVVLEMRLETEAGVAKSRVLTKIKPLDEEVIQGLHLMASAVNPDLATLIHTHRKYLEYAGCHKKELLVNALLNALSFSGMPEYFGHFMDEKREIYLMLTELLDYAKMQLINSENEPGRWTEINIHAAIDAITEVHKHFFNKTDLPEEIQTFEPWKAEELYLKFAEIIEADYRESKWAAKTGRLKEFVLSLKADHNALTSTLTLIHNDFNSRNVGIREDGRACIYDWELAVLHFPHRDIVEFLSFTLPTDFSETEFLNYLDFHQALYQPGDEKKWKEAYLYCVKEYLVTRVSFYLTGRIVLDFAFTDHVVSNTFRMIEILENKA